MVLKFKKLNEKAVIPSFAKEGDAGLDLVATEITNVLIDDVEVLGLREVKFGLAVEIPLGYVGLLFPRSSMYKSQTLLSNSVGVIDSGYRGELKAFMYGSPGLFGYSEGDKVLQLVVMPLSVTEIQEVDELTPSERGDGGFGSTGK